MAGWSGQWLRWLERRRPAVRDRVLRFNPAPVPGQKLRGYHRTDTAFRMWVWRGDMSRGSFIRTYGRAAWAHVPEVAKRRDGRRIYVRRFFLVDFGDQLQAVACGEQERLVWPRCRAVVVSRGSRKRPAVIEYREDAA